MCLGYVAVRQVTPTRLVKPDIASSLGLQLGRGSVLQDLAVFQHEHPIGNLHRRQRWAMMTAVRSAGIVPKARCTKRSEGAYRDEDADWKVCSSKN